MGMHVVTIAASGGWTDRKRRAPGGIDRRQTRCDAAVDARHTRLARESSVGRDLFGAWHDARMNSSKNGTVKAVSAKLGLQTMPLAMRLLRKGASEVLSRLSTSAISPERCGPGPRLAMARR